MITAAAAAKPARTRAPARRRSLLGYLLMPRPKDLFKALLMPLTFGLAVLATGRVDGTMLLRAVIVLAALELLVYPARYQWNDVRGFAADQRHPSEADRGRLPGPIDRAREHVLASTVVALARVAITAALPFLLPGLHLGGILLWVVLGVFGVAIAYEGLRSAGTGRTDAVPPPVRPSIVLLWVTVGAGYVVRGLTGLALVVDLGQHVALGVAAAVTLWAYGVGFVTARWAIESTAFARLRLGRVDWTADATQAREHLLALVRWLPAQADPAVVSATHWAALRGRTPLSAPWNVATVVAGAAAAVTGRLLAGPATTAVLLALAAAGGLAALIVVAAPRSRGVAVAAGGLLLVGGLTLLGTPEAVTVVLPWLAVLLAYVRFSSGSLRTMGALGDRLRAAAGRLLLPCGRALVGRETWNALAGSESARG